MALSDGEKRIVLAIGQTMFPRDGVLSIDADDARVVAWVEDYVERLPPLSRGQIRAMLNGFDLGYAAFTGKPRDRFASARPADRAAYLESWERSTTYSSRMLHEALRAMFTFAYVDSEGVDRAIRPADASTSRSRAAEEG